MTDVCGDSFIIIEVNSVRTVKTISAHGENQSRADTCASRPDSKPFVLIVYNTDDTIMAVLTVTFIAATSELIVQYDVNAGYFAPSLTLVVLIRSAGWASAIRYAIKSNTFPPSGQPTAVFSLGTITPSTPAGILEVDTIKQYPFTPGTYSITFQVFTDGVSNVTDAAASCSVSHSCSVLLCTKCACWHTVVVIQSVSICPACRIIV